MRHGSARDLPPHWYRYLLAALIAWCVLAGRPVHATDDGVSERAALYEESSTDPTGQRLVGSAVWRVDPAKSDTQAGDVTVRAIAETGVDRISIGSLTKDVKAIDFSMRFEEL